MLFWIASCGSPDGRGYGLKIPPNKLFSKCALSSVENRSLVFWNDMKRYKRHGFVYTELGQWCVIGERFASLSVPTSNWFDKRALPRIKNESYIRNVLVAAMSTSSWSVDWLSCIVVLYFAPQINFEVFRKISLRLQCHYQSNAKMASLLKIFGVLLIFYFKMKVIYNYYIYYLRSIRSICLYSYRRAEILTQLIQIIYSNTKTFQ